MPTPRQLALPHARCLNCAREISTGGGAGGMCSRCYQHHRRHGEWPAKELMLAGDKSARLLLRLQPHLHRLIELGAEREGCSATEWVRRACRARAEALKLKVKP